MAIMAQLSLINSHVRASSSTADSLSGTAGRFFKTWRDRARERHALAFLNDRELHDLGISPWEVAQEVRKPFWRG